MGQIQPNMKNQIKVHSNTGGPLLYAVNMQFPLRHLSLLMERKFPMFY